jgi:hypothetical protein
VGGSGGAAAGVVIVLRAGAAWRDEPSRRAENITDSRPVPRACVCGLFIQHTRRQPTNQPTTTTFC